MNKIAEYFRLILFACGVLVGVQVPSFVDQYGKSLESHYIESNFSLNEFQDDADKYFSGDLSKLIKHYQDNPDQIFNDGGDSIDAIFQRNQLLEQAITRYNSSTFSSYTQIVVNPIPEIRDEVWTGYTYGIILDKFAVVFGLAFGLSFAFAFSFLFFLLKSIVRLLKRPKLDNKWA